MAEQDSVEPIDASMQIILDTQEKVAEQLGQFASMRTRFDASVANMAQQVKVVADLPDLTVPRVLAGALNTKFDALNSTATSIPKLSLPDLAGLRDQLSKVAIDSISWRDRLDQIATTPVPVGPSPVVTAAVETREEVRRMAEILLTTSEQIGALATVAQAALGPLPRLEELSRSMLDESGKLRGVVEQGQRQADRSSKRMTWLTVGIFALTFGILLLTAVLAFGVHLSLPGR